MDFLKKIVLRKNHRVFISYYKESIMKKIFAILLAAVSVFSCFILSGCRKNQTEVFELPKEYQLSFSEEFENGYDETIWAASQATP